MATVNELTSRAIQTLADAYNATTKYLMHPVYNVSGFGAKGDGISDDTAKIKDAIDACAAVKSKGTIPVLYFPSCQGYAVSSPIVVPASISVIMEAPLIYTGAEEVIVLTIGEKGLKNTSVYLKLFVRRQQLSDWTNENNIGIKMINTQTSKIDITESSGFTIGVQAMGSSQGFVYNTVNLGRIVDNKYAVDVVNENSGTGIGWSNECLYLNGRLASTGANAGKSRYGVRVRTLDNPPIYNDSNLFMKPSFELLASTAAPGEAIPILIECGAQNEFHACRSEGNSPTFARVMNNSVDNTFDVSIGLATIEDVAAQPTSYYTDRRTRVLAEAKNLVFSSPALHKVAAYYDGSTTVHIPGIHVRTSADSNTQKALNNIVMNPNYLELPGFRGLGMFLRTTKNKRFVIRQDIESGYGGQIHIKCHDANGTVLTNAGASHPYVTSEASKNPYYNPNYGGVYTSNTDAGEMYYFKVKEEVAYIEVIFSGGSNPLRTRGFSIFTLDTYKSTVWLGYEEVVRNGNLATAPPTVGTWPKGKVLYNDNKIELGAVGSKYVVDGWECIAAGTPGTWIQKRSLTGN